ncbi:hypothetical protein H8S23_07735 [Anaerofilum sp. BX8]|uniref:Uncharacterized protein n=1 Tax=Anaerofilum hominis TaxID=2763016 RepID=A0A923I958_9FIRM|nr:hypothetical protein [Anaerofilum hominis]MBC5581399.1 hypothetical protein [Anaerofilum hominis]
MRENLKKLLGFRSNTPWKKIVAVLYYLICLAVFAVGLVTPLPIEAGLWDVFVYKVSVTVIFLWMISPAIFLSETPLRRRLPLFRQRIGSKSLIGMMIVFILFTYLFAMTESWHSPEYKAAYEAYNTAAYNAFIVAGGGQPSQGAP